MAVDAASKPAEVARAVFWMASENGWLPTLDDNERLTDAPRQRRRLSGQANRWIAVLIMWWDCRRPASSGAGKEASNVGLPYVAVELTFHTLPGSRLHENSAEDKRLSLFWTSVDRPIGRSGCIRSRFCLGPARRRRW